MSHPSSEAEQHRGSASTFGRRSLLTMGAGLAIPAVAGMMPSPAVATGWRTVFFDGFTKSFKRGGWKKYGGSRYLTYDGHRDTSTHGLYSSSRVLSSSNGALDWYLRSVNGQPLVCAIVPWTQAVRNLTWARYSFRFRIPHQMPGFKMAPLLWPNSNNWGQGEIDFPEVDQFTTAKKYYAAVHPPRAGSSTPGTATVRSTGVPAVGTNWHTAVLTRLPGKVTMKLDNHVVSFTSGLPTVPMHFVLQVETRIGAAPKTSISGHVRLDWLKIEVPTS